MSDRPTKRVYGRRLGRPLNKERAGVLDMVLPHLEIPAAFLTEKGDLSPEALFGAPLPALWLEIGFGNGEHIIGLMEQHPDWGFIGAEPFINGMAALLKSLRNMPQNKIRVLMDDAMLAVNSLIDNSLDGIYVLNPDPWPKKRHHKRRIVSQKNLNAFARTLKPGGLLVMSTDVPDLAEWMVTQASMHPAFEWTAESAADWRNPPPGWIKTRYEVKRAKGADKMAYLVFKKI